MYTIKDVAKKADVSISTVSRCLNKIGNVSEETSRNVLKTAKEMGFELKKYRRRKNKVVNDVIGVLVTEYNAFFTAAIEAIEHVAERNGMNVLICDTQERPGREIQCLEMLRSRVDGLIVVPASQTVEYNSCYLKEIDNNVMPVVLLDRDLSNEHLDGVFVDGFRGAYNGVQALIDQGHSKIATISGPTSNKPGLDRLNGYLEALKVNNIPIREDYILYGEFNKELAYELTKKLLTLRKDVTAIFSANLVMAFGCLKAIDYQGMKIPDDISFITFDDYFCFDMSNFNLSVIDNPAYQLGEEAAISLINRIKGGKRHKNDPSRRIILMPHLILRGSEKFPTNKIR